MNCHMYEVGRDLRVSPWGAHNGSGVFMRLPGVYLHLQQVGRLESLKSGPMGSYPGRTCQGRLENSLKNLRSKHACTRLE